jgi:hypothetical protein
MDYKKFIKGTLRLFTISELVITSGKQGSARYLLPSVLGGDDKYYSSVKGKFIRKLKELDPDLTKQIYYDILVLGLTNSDQRPRCPAKGCSNSLKFISIQRGYEFHCSPSCSGSDITEETREKISKSLTGKKLPDKVRRKMSDTHKRIPLPKGFEEGRLRAAKKPKSESHKKNLSISVTRYFETHPEAREESSRRMIQYCIDHPEFIENFINSGVFNSKKGYYSPKKSTTRFYYRSSWELDLLKMLEVAEYVVSIDKPSSIPYRFKGRSKLYYPDFKVLLSSGITAIIEVKPYHFLNDDMVVAKRKAAIKYCSENGFRYITLTQYEIYSDEFNLVKLLETTNN